jgi:hypothetical protein
MKKNMKTITKKIIGTILLLLITTSLNAQVTIGSAENPAESAVLDLNTGGPGNLGLLLPRVALTSADDDETIASPATGLMVYASGTDGLPAGIYVWDGAKWQTNSTSDACDGVIGADGRCYRRNDTQELHESKRPTCVLGWTYLTHSDLIAQVSAADWYAKYGDLPHWRDNNINNRNVGYANEEGMWVLGLSNSVTPRPLVCVK